MKKKWQIDYNSVFPEHKKMNDEELIISEKVHEIFKERHLTLSVAESCTGGLISHYITAVAGASIFFKAGIIAYSGQTKKDILKISADTLALCGMVSRQTALEMADNARTLAKTDYSLATTGNLGPEVIEDKEQGRVFIAVSGKGKNTVRELKLAGDRMANKEQASLAALRLLVEFVEENEKDS